MATIKDLQKLIEEKAKKRFDNDFNADVKLIRNSELFSRVSNCDTLFIDKTHNGEEITESAYCAFKQGAYYYKYLQEYWLPIYIERESKQLLADVEAMKEQFESVIGQLSHEDD